MIVTRAGVNQQADRRLQAVQIDDVVTATGHQCQSFDAVDVFQLQAGPVQILTVLGIGEDVERVAKLCTGDDDGVKSAAAVDFDAVVFQVVDQRVAFTAR